MYVFCISTTALSLVSSIFCKEKTIGIMVISTVAAALHNVKRHSMAKGETKIAAFVLCVD